MRKLVQLRPVSLNATERRLSSCFDIADLRKVAKRRIPRPVFDYVDGAADEEIAVKANAAAFRAWQFLPRALAGVGTLDTTAPVLGDPLPMPLLLGPAGYTRMMHPDGEIGAARAALRHGLPYTLSTMAATGIEELRAGVGGAPPGSLWFQLYVTRDREQAHDLVRRAADSGFGTLVVTVDTLVAGNRLRDQRNGLTIPPSLTLGTVVSVGAKPGYWWRLLSGPALDYANFAGGPRTTIRQTADFFDPDVSWSDI
jgi:L-lactate dehydrogenase (cytochrome)